MKAITINSQIKVFSQLPNKWGSILNYRRAGSQQHYNDGFRDVVQPTFNSETHKRGEIYFDEANDVYTYEVIEKTEAEIQQEIISASSANKRDLIQSKLEETVVNEAQEGEDTEALDNQDLFPMWENDFDYTVDFKCQDFNNENELKLYKCLQAHTSQSDWRPKDVPALFVLMAYPGEIPVFIQPTGAHDAYNTGDRVHFPTINDPVYESTIDNNVWSPTNYPQGWQLIE